MKSLSSDLTWIMKFGLSTLSIGLFSLGTAFVFVSPEIFNIPEEKLQPIKWNLIISLIIGTAIAYWYLLRLKKVYLDGNEFIISNLSKEIRLNINDVEKVTGSIFMNPEFAWLHLKSPSEFGNKIQFMPPQRFFKLGFSWHPIVDELNVLIKNENRI